MSDLVESHIQVDDTGEARIRGTRLKVIQLVMAKIAHGLSPEELKVQYPDLSLAQIHSAFAYYFDHQSELDRLIREDFEEAEKLRPSAGESPLHPWPDPKYFENQAKYPIDELAKHYGRYVGWSFDGTRILGSGKDEADMERDLAAKGIDPATVVGAYVHHPDVVLL